MSPVQLLRSLPAVQRRAWLASLEPELALEISQTALFWLRPEQREPRGGDYYLWMIITGRGWGKTFAASHLVHRWARNPRALAGGVLILAGPTYGDVRHKMVEAPGCGVLATAHRRFVPTWSPAQGRGILTWPNGVVAYCVSGSDPDAFRGFNAARLWAEEFASWQDPERAWREGAALALRRGASPRAVLTSTPIPLPFLERMMTFDRCVLSGGSTFDNTVYGEHYLEQIRAQYVVGSDLYEQEVLGKILRRHPKAIFSTETIARFRTYSPPAYTRKVIAVDPAVSDDGASTAECGISVCAEGIDGHCYVLADETCSGDPMYWAPRVAELWAQHGADLVIGEKNQGGKLVEMALRGVARNIPYRSVWSSHGKTTRAEPVAHHYRRGMVHHVGVHQLLEHQMTAWWPGSGMPSPDRMDALVFALVELAGLSQSDDSADANETWEAYA